MLGVMFLISCRVIMLNGQSAYPKNATLSIATLRIYWQMLSTTLFYYHADCPYAVCHYADCPYSECRGAT
jgi:hypothetical protein